LCIRMVGTFLCISTADKQTYGMAIVTGILYQLPNISHKQDLHGESTNG
jgi:hypothetical protein